MLIVIIDLFKNVNQFKLIIIIPFLVFPTNLIGKYVESATDIDLGGRTGLTAIFIVIFFLLSLVFTPIVLSLSTPRLGFNNHMFLKCKYNRWSNNQPHINKQSA